jgi:hypothetical protein
MMSSFGPIPAQRIRHGATEARPPRHRIWVMVQPWTLWRSQGMNLPRAAVMPHAPLVAVLLWRSHPAALAKPRPTPKRLSGPRQLELVDEMRPLYMACAAPMATLTEPASSRRRPTAHADPAVPAPPSPPPMLCQPMLAARERAAVTLGATMVEALHRAVKPPWPMPTCPYKKSPLLATTKVPRCSAVTAKSAADLKHRGSTLCQVGGAERLLRESRCAYWKNPNLQPSQPLRPVIPQPT